MQLKRTYNQQEFGQLHAGTQSELERTASENSRLHARVWALEEDRDALMVFRDTLLVSLISALSFVFSTNPRALP